MQNFSFKNLISFDTFLTPLFIQYVYLFFSGISVFTYFVSVIISRTFTVFIGGMISLLVTLLFLRIFCEGALVLFSIDKSLKEINNKNSDAINVNSVSVENSDTY